MADEAEKKTRVAEEDREAKRKPYEADPLFMYLWNEKFGTADYKAGYVARFFDRMIAKKIRWPDARANYAMLNEIPQRLREHAERCRAAVDREQANLARAEADALKEVGAADLVRQGGIGPCRARRGRDGAGRRPRCAGRFREPARRPPAADPAYEQAIQMLADADSRQDVRELFEEAARTATREDERIVRQIETAETKLARAEEEIAHIRAQVRDLARRRADIERERDHFRQRGYDSPYSSFGNEAVIGQVLGGLLEGLVKGAILRDTLKDGYRQRDHGWGGGSGNGGVVLGPGRRRTIHRFRPRAGNGFRHGSMAAPRPAPEAAGPRPAATGAAAARRQAAGVTGSGPAAESDRRPLSRAISAPAPIADAMPASAKMPHSQPCRLRR